MILKIITKCLIIKLSHRTKFIGVKNGNNRLAWLATFGILRFAASRGKLQNQKF